jgi:hypothetical protein
VAGVVRRADLSVSGEEKILRLELQTVQPIVDYTPYVSEESAACFFRGEDVGRKRISGVG